jgi:hypothetical protein
MKVACAMSAQIPYENICGVANAAISRFVPDVDSTAFERLETCSYGLNKSSRLLRCQRTLKTGTHTKTGTRGGS